MSTPFFHRPLLEDLPHWPLLAPTRLTLHPPPAFAGQPARCTVYVDEAVLPEPSDKARGGRARVHYSLPGSTRVHATSSEVRVGGVLWRLLARAVVVVVCQSDENSSKTLQVVSKAKDGRVAVMLRHCGVHWVGRVH